MNTLITDRFRVQILGFSAEETAMITSTFALSARRATKYETYQSESLQDRPDLYLVDSDMMTAMLELMTLEPNTVRPALLVGQDRQGTEWPLIERPIRWSRLLGELDQSVELATQAKLRVAHSDQSFIGNVMPRRQTSKGLDLDLNETGLTLEDESEELNFQHTLHESQLAEYALIRQPGNSEDEMAEGVLVLDADAQIRQLVAHTLLPFGLLVDPAESSDQAISMLAFKPYSVLLIGPNLSIGDNFAFCKQIKSTPAMQALKVILIGSKNASFDRMRARFSGCDAYVALPLDEDKLISSVAKLLLERSA